MEKKQSEQSGVVYLGVCPSTDALSRFQQNFFLLKSNTFCFVILGLCYARRHENLVILMSAQ